MLQFLKKVEKKTEDTNIINIPNALKDNLALDETLAKAGLTGRLVEIEEEVEEEIEIVDDPRAIQIEFPIKLGVHTDESLPFFKSIQYKLGQIFIEPAQ